MFETIEREAEANKVTSGHLSNYLAEILNAKDVTAITRFGVTDAYIIPADVWRELKRYIAEGDA